MPAGMCARSFSLAPCLAVTVVGLGLAGDQLSVGIMSSGVIPDRQVISEPVAGSATPSATPDVSAAPAMAPVAEVRVPPEEPAASGPAAEAARTVPAPPASRDRGPLEDEVALAPEAVETAMGPPRDRARLQPDLAGFATLPVRPAVLVAADVLAAGARLELGSHGLRPEGRGQITERPALAPERPWVTTAFHAIAVVEAAPRFDRPALSEIAPSAITSHAASEVPEAPVPPALTVAESLLASHGSGDIAVVVKHAHAVREAIDPWAEHGVGATPVEATPHALGADDAGPVPHERPQPAPIATALLAPAVFEVSTPRAIAKKERAAMAKAKAPAVAAATDPLTLVVSLDAQKIDVYRGTVLVTSAKVSSGMPGHETRTGVFSILEKRRYHRSNLYSGAPMPWMQRLTRSGTALHAGVIPGYPASHGCVRLPFSFAPKLFEMTAVGGNVVVADARLVPEPIDHPNLFQPLARPAPQIAGNGEAAPAPPSDGEQGPRAPRPMSSSRARAGANSRSAHGGSSRP
jgi:lipoprotein-anchoring transpeptidase ErfK/SrfK